jgi:recombination endonuclease VII
MTDALYQSLPVGFLKVEYRGWRKLRGDVQFLILKLAKEQNYKCFFCNKNRRLYIDHDHEAVSWPPCRDKYTVNNVRGLLCHRCNTHLWLHERNERGGYGVGWDHVFIVISDREYEDYTCAFECRLVRQHEEAMEASCNNPGTRRRLLDKFDDWKRGWEPRYPWPQRFEEIKERRHGKIRTPGQAVRALVACMKFVVEEYEKEPNFQPPDEFVKLMVRMKPVFEELRPIAKARIAEIASRPN